MHVLNSLMPVFLIIALGNLLCRTGFLSDSFAKGSDYFFTGLSLSKSF